MYIYNITQNVSLSQKKNYLVKMQKQKKGAGHLAEKIKKKKIDF